MCICDVAVAFGLIIAGAAGYGVYALYQKVFGPYRRSRYGDDPFSGVSADVDRLNEMFGRKRRASGSAEATGSRELDALVQGLPLVVRGLVKTIFSFVGSAMKASMERAGELRRLTNERVQSHPRVLAQMGAGVSVSTPQQWAESSALLAVNCMGGAACVGEANDRAFRHTRSCEWCGENRSGLPGKRLDASARDGQGGGGSGRQREPARAQVYVERFSRCWSAV